MTSWAQRPAPKQEGRKGSLSLVNMQQTDTGFQVVICSKEAHTLILARLSEVVMVPHRVVSVGDILQLLEGVERTFYIIPEFYIIDSPKNKYQ